MINLGFYIEDLGDPNCIFHISSEINRAKKSSEVLDASIFFDNIGPLNININAGIFNSTDIWNFNGDLIVFSTEMLEKAMNYINNINIYLCYGWKPCQTLSLLQLVYKYNTPVIALDKNAANNFKRITNKNVISINENLNNIIDTILEYKNG